MSFLSAELGLRTLYNEYFSLDFQLYTHVEHFRTLVHSQASAILSFIQGKHLILTNYSFVKSILKRLDQWFQ
jgi:hypothetical protein